LSKHVTIAFASDSM